jgi:hypothetical protein
VEAQGDFDAPKQGSIAMSRTLTVAADQALTGSIIRPALASASGATDERRRAPRIARTDVPWVSKVRMPWGLGLDLINISSSGLLVESTSKLSSGATYDLEFDGPNGPFLVKARFIRSDVGRVDGRGVRYHSAAAFDRELDLAGGRVAAPAPSPQQAMAELLAAVIAESDDQQEPADLRFARGLRHLFHARDVLVRRTPILPADDSESIYFTVADDGQTRAVLQVLFDPDRAITPVEFRLLKAAASLTSAVIEIEKSRQDTAAAASTLP